MAYLVKCSLCGRDVSSVCKSCPGCGHDVARDFQKKETERKVSLIKRGLCPNCESSYFIENKTYEGENEFLGQKSCECIEFRCGSCKRLFKKSEKTLYVDGSGGRWKERYLSTNDRNYCGIENIS